MATWGQVEKELINSQAGNGPPDFDGVRRRYMRDLADYTERSLILYETAGFAPPPGAAPDDTQISLDPDVGAFMEVVHGLDRERPIDLILHSPRGTAEAAESIVEYIRGRFPGLRVIVPVAAMSAATMMAMAADEIVLGDHSQLGPIDPQMTIATPEGPRTAPAAAIRKQFRDATEDLKQNPDHIAAWLPIIRGLSPALLQICDDAEHLATSMVTDWLEKYMFASEDDARAKAEAVARVLSDYDQHMSHGRRLGKAQLRDLGLRVVDLEEDDKLQDLVLSIHHSVNHLMNHTGTVKIVENHLGKAFIRRVGQIAVPVQQGPPPKPPRVQSQKEIQPRPRKKKR
ncbi:MAG: serine protease [bacterium]|nr:serine protease [bacterium]